MTTMHRFPPDLRKSIPMAVQANLSPSDMWIVRHLYRSLRRRQVSPVMARVALVNMLEVGKRS